MHLLNVITPLLFLLQTCATEQYLTVTAVVSDPLDNARLQCWEFETPFSSYPTVGRVIHLADVSNLTYVVLPPRSREGIHKPPRVMFFVLLRGLAHVTFPTNLEELWITPDENGFIVAADTAGVGHFTEYPLDIETVALQIPFKDGKMPGYRVLGEGACGRSGKAGREEDGRSHGGMAGWLGVGAGVEL